MGNLSMRDISFVGGGVPQWSNSGFKPSPFAVLGETDQLFVIFSVPVLGEAYQLWI